MCAVVQFQKGVQDFSNIGKEVTAREIYFCPGDEKEIDYTGRLQAAGGSGSDVYSGTS